MHICFLNPPLEFYSPISGGAIATIIMQNAKQLLAAGHRVTVLTATNGDEIYREGEVIPLRVPQREDLSLPQRAVSRLRRKFVEWDYHYYEYYLGAFTRALKGLNPEPDVIYCYNDLVSPKYIKKTVPSARVLVNLQNEQRTSQQDIRETIAAVDRFVACSTYIRDWLAENHRIPAAKLAVINSGIDLDAFAPRTDYLEPPQTLKALFIGRIDPNKGPDIAADAVGLLQKEGLPITFTVAGGVWFYNHEKDWTDPFFCTLQEKIKAAHGEYVGHVTRPNVPALVRSHDVSFVLSRSNEPFGLVVLEAMASGCAVISSNRGGLPEACGGAAMLVDPDDFDAVVSNLRRLATEPDFLKSEKQKAVAHAAKASWAAGADQLLALLRELES